MNYVYYAVDYSDSLSHHGIKGQKWGVRRFQTSNGTWTNEGLKRRRSGSKRYQDRDSKELVNSVNKYVQDARKAKSKLDKFDKEHPELTKFENGKLPLAYRYSNSSFMEQKKLKSTLSPSTINLLEKRIKLDDNFNKLSINNNDNENWNQYYNNSKKYVDNYGHEEFQKLLGDDANYYYTENWRKGLDDLIDYDSGNFYYRDLNEELW